MNRIELFSVAPHVPERLHFLETLSRNLWWCWHSPAIELFRRISPRLWKEAQFNPIRFLNLIPQDRLEELLEDAGFLQQFEQVEASFNAEIGSDVQDRHTPAPTHSVAYFSLEYGFHESVRLYSGGLGVLAGDHLKAASDIGLPLVAVGLLYRQGYFQQYLSPEGWQQEHYPENPVQDLPIKKAHDRDGQDIVVHVPLADGELKAVVWRLDVGRVPVYLLDTNLPENAPEFRAVTAQLYGGNRETRLRQELLLGVGGYRALVALGYHPHVCHINEGHAAFLNIARLGHLVKTKGCDLDGALEIVSRTNVFTTHTPVPAGNETFEPELLRPHLDALSREVAIPTDLMLSWGQPPAGHKTRELSMTVFGLRMARNSNGVSELHGHVARKMWQHLWPDTPQDEIPIRHITNGIHAPSWLSPELDGLLEHYIGPEWSLDPADPKVLRRVDQIPDEELWRAHESSRSRLVRTARELSEEQYGQRNASRAEIARAKSVLDHDALTVGFARRFATYKRSALLLRDPERFEALLKNDDRPVQFIFAGKAHPADDAGKDLIRQLVQFAVSRNLRHRFVFLEDYDIAIARSMVQGVDVWLNTPRRPQEASGTSGMKAAVNGGLNVSVLDGWWCEGYRPENGWAIGRGEEYDSTEYQDTVESKALFNVLENEVIPCYYDRPFGDLPNLWIKMMKASIRMVLEQFTSHRMVCDYRETFYERAFAAYESLTADNANRARGLVRQSKRLRAQWRHVRAGFPTTDRNVAMVRVGDTFTVESEVHLGELRPEEVDVQVYYGPVDPQNEILESHVADMEIVEDRGSGVYLYRQTITCTTTGRFGFTARVIADGEDWSGVMPGFITWADGKVS
ncbi:MAG: alpha-glucan family phosphorylase [Lentisphaerae bacterium]|jgi:glycogen phosphorylase|nr:alpha-glucan family phosphorylase [Lentisphaerota bacterium]MBT4819196.1 alpha-glucan family phosphorylase [Lentisphaerota bacterium]MBT5606605.1 alpha-glucan family phosphorylase [Lentisphaerota bacterium]MBT7059552.1 alpha-glucan family phosphorylase [Lentisphaerota bacterium]MBT7843011.1 alpha-glucan family phosphorylase [Lentisphaerota bacterium]